jgi:hypothetical protein
MPSARLLIAVLVASSTLTACSSADITSPTAKPSAPNADQQCRRGGYLVAGGNKPCGEVLDSQGTGGITIQSVLGEEPCRGGYLVAGGKSATCEP